MSRFRDLCIGAFFLLAACAVIPVIVDLRQVLHDAHDVIGRADGAIAEGQRRMVDTSQNANGVLIQLGLAADQWAQASAAQRKSLAVWSQQTTEILALTKSALTKFDTEFNGNTLPEVTAALRALRKTIEDIQPALASLTEASAGAAKTMNDPAIMESLAEIKALLEKANVMLASGNVTAANVQAMSEDLRKAVARATKPAKWFWSMLKGALGISADVAKVVHP